MSELNEMNTNLSAGQEDKSKNNSRGNFMFGALCGAFVMFLISVGIMVILINSMKKGTQEADLPADTGFSFFDDSVSSNLLDKVTVNKLERIAKLFDTYSIYDIPMEDLQRGMIDGLVKGSGDKYAEYYSKEELDELMTGYDGVFYGIGALLFLDDDGWVTVSSVYEDSPAEKAGIQAKDVITEVDGNSTYGLTLNEIVSMIRGDKDTQVDLTIARPGENSYRNITATRGEVQITTVTHEMLTDEIGYIYIQEFDEVTIEQFEDALTDIQSQDAKGLVLDLRTNSGGLLNSAVEILRMMLPEGMVVYTEDVFGQRTEYKCDGSREIQIPIVVLTNEYTASASEIVTGGLQDTGKAVVMGTNTYGKGVVQTFKTMKDGSGMKLTTAQYFTAGGRAIDGVGIAPDIELEFDSESYYGEENYDNQKDEAIKYLEKKIQ